MHVQVHNLKGTAGSFGFFSLSSQAALIEAALQDQNLSLALDIVAATVNGFTDDVDPSLRHRALADVTPQLAGPTRSERIFVLDDDADYIDYLSLVLSSMGFQLTASQHPGTAVDAMLNGQFDLALIDIEMNGDNGLDICRDLRAKEGSHRTPIMVLTANTGSQDRIDAFASGADDFISKPVVVGELQARINIRMERSQLSRERDDALARLNRSHDHLLGILNQLAVGIATYNSEGKFQYASATFAALLATTVAQLEGTSWPQLPTVAPADAYLLHAELNKLPARRLGRPKRGV